MPIATMTVRGSEQLRRNLERLAGAERRRAQANGLKAGASVVETKIKDLLSTPGAGRDYVLRNGTVHRASAPGQPPAVDTGFLLNSIQVDEPVKPTEATISANAEYAVHLEFGTSKMAARPFMRPALDQHEGEIIDAVEATIAAFVARVQA